MSYISVFMQWQSIIHICIYMIKKIGSERSFQAIEKKNIFFFWETWTHKYVSLTHALDCNEHPTTNYENIASYSPDNKISHILTFGITNWWVKTIKYHQMQIHIHTYTIWQVFVYANSNSSRPFERRFATWNLYIFVA